MGFLKLVLQGALAVRVQQVSNEGFEDGSTGQPPRAVFGRDEFKEAYETSYKRGQQSATTNLSNTISKKLKD